MPRYVEIVFVRHGDKTKVQGMADPEQLTEKGWEQARARGKALGSGITTFFRSSIRDRTRDTAKGISEGMGGKAQTTRVGQRIHFDFNKPPRLKFFGPDFEAEYGARGADAAFGKWMQGAFDAAKGATPEETGVRMAVPLRGAYRLAQGKGKPVRIIVVSHGGSNLESLFYALTGVNPLVVGKGKEKGTFKLTEPFHVIMNGPTMNVRFRSRKFTVQRAIKPLLQARAPGRQKIRENIIQQLTQRRMQLLEQAKKPKPIPSGRRNVRKRK